MALVLALAACALLTGAAPDPVSPAPPAAPAAGLSIDAVAAFSPLNAVHLSGTRDADASLTVKVGTTTACADIPADPASTTWSCTASVSNGPGVIVTVTQTLAGATSQVTSTPFDVLGPPQISGGAGLITPGLVSGQGFPGATVTTAVAGASGGCSSIVTSAGYWSCALTVGSGDWSVTATQARADLGGGASSSVSGSLDVHVDKDAPLPPRVTSPGAGSRITSTRVTYRGVGETGGTVDVYLDNTPVCSSDVVGSAWACAASAPTGGTHSVRAIQRDAAGNFSSPSPIVRIAFGPADAVAPPVAPPPPGTPSPTPTTPSPTPTTPGPTPTPLPYATSPHTGWGSPTDFGAALPTLASSISGGNWLLAPLLALAYLLLVALPLRLLASALRGRVSRPRTRFMGRNQPTTYEDDLSERPPVNPWLSALVFLVVATVLVVLSVGVNDEVKYLRLAGAVFLGLAVLNVVGTGIPGRLASQGLRAPGRPRFIALLLLAAVLAALLSRATGIHPRLVTGVLIGMGFARGLPARPRALVRLTELGSVTVLALLAWIAHGVVAGSGFGPASLRELTATVALAGIGSALVMVLPLASLPGRVLLEWSGPAWIASVLVVALFAGVLLLGVGGFPVVASLVVAGAFAAVSLAVWSWFRFVEPATA